MLCIDTSELEEVVFLMIQLLTLFASITGMIGLAYLALQWGKGSWREITK